MAKTSGKEELEAPEAGIYHFLSNFQKKTAFLPDYGFKKDDTEAAMAEEPAPSWPAIDKGTSTAGLVGGSLTLLLVVVIGFLFRRRSQVG